MFSVRIVNLRSFPDHFFEDAPIIPKERIAGLCELLPYRRRFDKVSVATGQFSAQAGQPPLILCQRDSPHHKVLRKFVVAPHFHAGGPIECRTSVTSGQSA